jgi:hypothetical protein
MRYFILFMFASFSFQSFALTNVDVFQSEVILNSEESSKDADAQARITGMKDVVVRVSGDRNATSNPTVIKALKQNAQYVTQLSYGQREGEKTLRVSFSAPHIRSLLSQAQLPIWPSVRANLLVWIVEEGPSERNIAWEHSTSEVLKQVRQQAQVRGLPLTVPVGDFDDVTGINTSDLWGGFVQPISKSSERYPVDGVLLVKVQGNQIRWTLYDQKPNKMSSVSRAPLSGTISGQEAATKVIDQVSDYYARNNAVVLASESSESIKVKFNQVNDAVSFFSLENQLKALGSVASVDILKVQGGQVTFDIHLLSTQQEFEQEMDRLSDAKKVDKTNFLSPLPVNQAIEVKGIDEKIVRHQESSYEEAPIAPVIPSEMMLEYEWQGKTINDLPKISTPPSIVDDSVEEVIE